MGRYSPTGLTIGYFAQTFLKVDQTGPFQRFPQIQKRTIGPSLEPVESLPLPSNPALTFFLWPRKITASLPD